MTHNNLKWSIDDLSKAMVNAISQRANSRFVKRDGYTIKFNGFWREGDKQNVCAWLDKATWHDAKTGEGGGCREFAKIAFNQSLPEFMDRFSDCSFASIIKEPIILKKTKSGQTANEIWLKLLEDSSHNPNPAETWLEKSRGFNHPRANISSGFASLTGNNASLFDLQYQSFIKQRLSLGPQIVAPIRGIHSNDVKNLFFRNLSVSHKNDKSRLLPNMGGWSDEDETPWAFGFPHLIRDFPKIVICEGMADYFAAECLLGESGNFLAVGAANAGALKQWATWLSTSKYNGAVTILYQLDRDKLGKVSSLGTGQSKATEALKILLQNKVSASLFRWASFLKLIKAYEHKPNDIADICQLFGSNTISDHFIKTLNEAN